MLSSSISLLQKQDVHIPNSLRKLISQIQCPSKKKKMSESNPLPVRRSRNANETDSFTKLYIEPNRKDAIKRKHKKGGWMPPLKSINDDSETNYSQCPTKTNDQEAEFPTGSFLSATTNPMDIQYEFALPVEDRRYNDGNSFKYPMQEIKDELKPESRCQGNKCVEHTFSHAENSTNGPTTKPSIEFVVESSQQTNVRNNRNVLTTTLCHQETETIYSKVECGSDEILVNESSKRENDFKIPSTASKTTIKSSIKTSFNNRKKWVTFNDIIENEGEQNFVDELYEGSEFQVNDKLEDEEFSKNTDNENLKSDPQTQNPHNENSSASIPAPTEQQKLINMIQQVKRMNDMITKARNEILKFGYPRKK